MKKFLMILAAFIVLMSGCSSIYQITIKRDDFEKITKYSTDYMMMYAELGNGPFSYIGFRKIIHDDKKLPDSYFLNLHIVHNFDPFIIGTGNTFSFLIDGNKTELISNQISDNDYYSEQHHCYQVYSINKDLINKLATAKDVRVKIFSTKNSFETRFTEKNYISIKDMATKF